MSEVHADDILAVIRERGWWKSSKVDRKPGGRACLSMALDAVTVNRVPATLVAEEEEEEEEEEEWEEWERWDAALKQAVRALFPGRAWEVPYSSYVMFNDHPDTTLADVELVVKEAEARL